MIQRGALFAGALVVALVVGASVVVAVLASVAIAGAGAVLVERVRGRTEWWAPGSLVLDVALVGVVGLGVIQLLPYGHEHGNPPVIDEPEWYSPRTRELMVDACFGCHSNEVEWPWYSDVAPISWIVTNHVDEGREAVNYSEFGQRKDRAHETTETVVLGSMPPGYYTVLGLHSEADLTDEELQELLVGLKATPGLRDGAPRLPEDG